MAPGPVARQAPLSMGLLRQVYWNGLPLPAPGDLLAAAAAKSLQSCPTLCNPIDGSPPGSPVPGILQARTLEWVAIAFSGDLLDPGIKPEFPVSPALQADSLPLSQQGSYIYIYTHTRVCVCVCMYACVYMCMCIYVCCAVLSRSVMSHYLRPHGL